MKKTKVLALFLGVILLLTGCVSSGGKYLTIMSITSEDDHSFSMEYESFDGKKYYVFTPKTDGTLKMDFVTESGTLKCTVITGTENQFVFNQSEIPTGKEEIPIKKGKKYTVWFYAEKHKGSFRFDWSQETSD